MIRCCILGLVLPFSIALTMLGCADLRRDAERTQAQMQTEYDALSAAMQSVVGKQVIAISGPSKPVCIVFDDGTCMYFTCYKYPMSIEVDTTRVIDEGQLVTKSGINDEET
jgi:hypothetical protein